MDAATTEADGVGATALPPLALYVHLPWCVQKCPYCDFNSHALRDGLPETAYVDALLRDLAWEMGERPPGRSVETVFFGGGTPSLFSPGAIGLILDAVAGGPGLAAGAEVTLEANPGTADAENFRGYRDAGVDRLSIGVQSFDDAKLRALGRIHDGEAAARAVGWARRAGFQRLNLDLMFALPRQTPEEAEADLRRAIELAPDHISYYHLTLEPNTAFASAPPPLPDADQGAAMLDAGRELLEAAGYAGYETSAWAQPGQACEHNLNYWRFGDYLGIGAGAHGKLSRHGEGGLRVERRARHRHPRRYQETAGTAEVLQERREVASAELPFEFMMNAMRLHEGFEWSQFARTTGLDASAMEGALRRAAGLGLIERDARGVRPSERGRAHLNGLLELFL